VLVRDLRAALVRLNPELPAAGHRRCGGQADPARPHARSLLQHNQAFHKLMRDGVPVSYRDAKRGQLRQTQARVIDFRDLR
jgi:type I restriction enzyme R subunit